MWFDHHHVMSVPSSVGCLCYSLHRLPLRKMPLRLNICYSCGLGNGNKRRNSCNDRAVHVILYVRSKLSSKWSIQTVKSDSTFLFFSIDVWWKIMWDSGWCYHIEGDTDLLLDTMTTCPAGRSFHLSRVRPLPLIDWQRLSSTILWTRQQKPVGILNCQILQL